MSEARCERRCLLLFTKPARPGRVKTRLIGTLSAAQAAALHAAFLDDLYERLSRGCFVLCTAWALTPEEAVPTTHGRAVRQVGDDLGARLHHALAAAARDYPFVAAVGSDHPELTPVIIEEAFQRLEAGSDVVLGPAADGGYYLIALRRQAVRPQLFSDIPWSTDTVRAVTEARCAAAELSMSQLNLGRDIDTPEDLAALAQRLAGAAEAPPRTASLLAAWGWNEGALR